MVPAKQTKGLDIASPSTRIPSASAEVADVQRDILRVPAESKAFRYPATSLYAQNGDGGETGHSDCLSREELAQAIVDQGTPLSLAEARRVVDSLI